MTRWLKNHPYGVLLTGFGLGLTAGACMLVGALLTSALGPSRIVLPEQALHASATDSGDTFAMATGSITDGVEGVFFIDYLTGDLQCWVLNNRTGQLAGHFRQNVIEHLGVVPGKKQRYLLVTGLAPIRRGGTGIRPADCIVYVADANTGNFAAYMLPFNRNAFAQNAPQAAPMTLIGKGCGRTVNNLRAP